MESWRAEASRGQAKGDRQERTDEGDRLRTQDSGLSKLPMSSNSRILLELTSDPALLCVVRAAVATAAEKFGLDEAPAGQLKLAVDEALSNVIKHGYKGRTDQLIWVTLSPIGNGQRLGIEVVIEDRAEQVDLTRIKGRPLEELRPGGLGVHIIRQAVDVAEYEKRADGPGLRLTLKKFTEKKE